MRPALKEQAPPSILSTPVPKTDHPLGPLAQVWIVLNCMLVCGLIGTAAITAGCYYGWKLLAGRQIPGTVHDVILFASLVGSLTSGVLLAAWLLQRVGRKSINIALLTLHFVPVIGVFVTFICGIWELIRYFSPEHIREQPTHTSRVKLNLSQRKLLELLRDSASGLSLEQLIHEDERISSCVGELQRLGYVHIGQEEGMRVITLTHSGKGASDQNITESDLEPNRNLS